MDDFISMPRSLRCLGQTIHESWSVISLSSILRGARFNTRGKLIAKRYNDRFILQYTATGSEKIAIMDKLWWRLLPVPMMISTFQYGNLHKGNKEYVQNYVPYSAFWAKNAIHKFFKMWYIRLLSIFKWDILHSYIKLNNHCKCSCQSRIFCHCIKTHWGLVTVYANNVYSQPVSCFILP